MRYFIIIMVISTMLNVNAQQLLSLEDAINIAKKESYAAKMADFSYMSHYWSYRQYKASWLPSLNLSGALMNFNRSIVETRDYETGHVSYVDNNSLYNSFVLSVNQNIALADGTLSLRSELSRLDQFDYNQKTYNSIPLLLSYNQPLRRYSNIRWRSKIEPLQYEHAKRSYLEAMQSITMNVTAYYFNALAAQSNLRQSQAKYNDLKTLYITTQKKLELGMVTKGDLLQLELALLNTEMNINYNKLSLENHLFQLFSYLHITDYSNIELVSPVTLPQIIINVDDVIDKAYSNSTHSIAQHINILNAEQNLAYTKANNGLQVSFQAQVGFTQTANGFKSAYKTLKDNEVVGFTIRLPIYDWGLGKGKIRMAKAQLELVRTQVHQADLEFEQNIRTKVNYFNNQTELCRISKRALEIAEETYIMAYKRFENGAISVTDLNTANNELENAHSKYISQLNTFWTYYYDIQRITLYDYIGNREIECDFDAIIE